MRLFRKNLTFILIFIILIPLAISFFPLKEPGYALFVFGVSLLLFAIILCYHLEKGIKSALGRISDFSSKVSEGDFNLSSFDRSLDYLKPGLSSTFDELATKLKGTFSDLNKEKNELAAILDAISEGVIVVSENGEVTLANKSASAMLDLSKEHIGKPYWEVLRNRQLNEMLSETLEKQKGVKREINTIYPEDRQYLADTVLLDKPSREIIAVLFDITEFKKLEKIKADFVANVSHELKTPLTSIKGYTETIEDNAYENQEELMQFTKIISRNTNRLISIVADLLTLSELEGKYTNFPDAPDQNFERVNINDIITQTASSMEKEYRQKQVRRTMDLRKNLPAVYGIKFFLEQMFANLIDNATKYNKDGGEIKLTSFSNGTAVVVKIADTGIGISKEHQSRIFERFYRVDKDRSREVGGTGLGLSIVKHIVLVHGGNIDLESEIGMGSEFTITLPINTNNSVTGKSVYIHD